ncbi:hypothetical protein HYC85_016079 [Camellia sinensis]|uniref:Uncharacterized protein n=1 Tax=Camellia sinensis TaxID=4442 RepID=A0A7J7H0P9_CAMSI|nr:hypothetical protein HYC85_016079 [Camellia sinensis]
MNNIVNPTMNNNVNPTTNNIVKYSLNLYNVEIAMFQSSNPAQHETTSLRLTGEPESQSAVPIRCRRFLCQKFGV